MSLALTPAPRPRCSLFSALGCSSSDDDEHGGGPVYAMYEVIDDVWFDQPPELARLRRRSPRLTERRRASFRAVGRSCKHGATRKPAPTVTRYSVAADGKLAPEGELSFANYGLD
ncbi:MAG: hypothetical protein QM756_21580 [Polyangiaceae bacterium]